MTIEDILKTPVYLRANGQWARSSYRTAADLLPSLIGNDGMYVIELSCPEARDTLSGYCLVQGIDIEFVKSYRNRPFSDYIYKIGDL